MNEDRTCKSCQVTKTIQSFHKNGKSGRHYICAQCRNIKRKNWNKDWEKTPDRIYKAYKRSAVKRGLDFDLSKADFLFSAHISCVYCGDSLDKARFDRVNNDIGYCKDNIVPCCQLCNFLKNDLKKEVFLDHISKIYEYQKGK